MQNSLYVLYIARISNVEITQCVNVLLGNVKVWLLREKGVKN